MKESSSASGGYVCAICGQWILNGIAHSCPGPIVDTAGGYLGYVCPVCGGWVPDNSAHVCLFPMKPVTYERPKITRVMLKSKIYNAKVTESTIECEGSITIDSELMRMANILPYEQVHVLDIMNGERLVTYAIEGKADSGIVQMNGAAAKGIHKDDIVIILSYASILESDIFSHTPIVIKLDSRNRVVRRTL